MADDGITDNVGNTVTRASATPVQTGPNLVSARAAQPDGLRLLGGGVIDSSGAIVFPDNFAKTLTYNTDGTVNTVSFTDGTNTWTQTNTWTNGNLTGVSVWVRS